MLAFRATSRSKKRDSWETAAALQVLCTDLTFAAREPNENKRSVAGYSPVRRALWLRPNRLSDTTRDLIPLEHANELLYEDRTVVPKLRAFTKSNAFHDWQREPINIRGVLDPDQQVAYFQIAGKDAPVTLRWRGAILVGHDPKQPGEYGVFWIGVRDHHPSRARASERDQAFWLRWHSDFLEEIPESVFGRTIDEDLRVREKGTTPEKVAKSQENWNRLLAWAADVPYTPGGKRSDLAVAKSKFVMLQPWRPAPWGRITMRKTPDVDRLWERNGRLEPDRLRKIIDDLWHDPRFGIIHDSAKAVVVETYLRMEELEEMFPTVLRSTIPDPLRRVRICKPLILDV